MPADMWLPLLVMSLGLYAFAGFAVLYRMRTEILSREQGTHWVRALTRGEQTVMQSARDDHGI